MAFWQLDLNAWKQRSSYISAYERELLLFETPSIVNQSMETRLTGIKRNYR